jgi:Bacterial conjugation TrbI-like protein
MNLLHSRSTTLAIAVALAVVFTAVCYYAFRSPTPKVDPVRSQVVEGEYHTPLTPLPGKDDKIPKLAATSAPGLNLPPLVHYSPDSSNILLSVPDFAPYGKLLRCVTLFAIDTSLSGGPILAMVTDDLGHLQELIVPKGSFIYGWTQPGRMRDRVLSQTSWVLVFPTGEELILPGLALDANRVSETSWGPTDGSLGIRGVLVKSDNYAEAKLFTATLLSGAADAFQERQSTLIGSLPLADAKNAGLQGVGHVLDLYANQLLSRMENELYHVRVASGKSFYVFCTATIDRSKAKPGNSKWVTSSPQTKP